MADVLSVTTGQVDCRLVVATNDSTDDGVEFDTIAPSGFVYLRPRKKAFSSSEPSAIVIPDVISLAVNDEGYASMPTPEGAPTEEILIDLPAAEGMTWTVSFDLWIPAYPWQQGVERNKLHVPPFDIPVEAGKVTHIQDYLPAGVDPSTGTVWVKGDKGDKGDDGVGIASATEEDGILTVTLTDGTVLPGITLPKSTTPGPAPTLTTGTVTQGTSETDYSATVREIGTGKYALDLKMPRGPKGNDGAGLPTGGTTGQVPARTAAGGSEWRSAASLVPNATTSVAGLLSGADKARLDALPTTATVDSKDAATLTSAKSYTDLNAAKRPDLISTRQGTWVIGHRSGKWHYPEESAEAVQAMVDQGWIPEVDLWPLKDGTLVCIHDSTVQRTMTGTGAVNTFTLAQWRNMRVKPAMAGGRQGTPLTFEEYLQRWGGHSLLCAEVKDAAQAVVVGDMVVKYGLEKAILLQSFDIAAARGLVARGLKCTFLMGATYPTGVTPASLKAEGFEYVSPQDTMSAANRDALTAAGLKVIVWNYNTKAAADSAKAAGVFGYFSDDPWRAEGRPAWSAVDPWRNGNPGGWIEGRGSSAATVGVTAPMYLIDGGIGTRGQNAANRPADMASAASVLFCDLWNSPWIDTTKDFTISFDVNLGPYADTAEGTTGTIGGLLTGLYIWRNSLDPEAPFLDAANPGQYGWTFGVRRNGQINCWKYDNGAAASAIITNPTTAAGWLTSAGAGKTRVTFTVRADGPAVRLYSSGNNNYAASADTFRPGVCRIGVRMAAATEASISNLTISGTLL